MSTSSYVPPNTFFAPTQEEANASASAYAESQIACLPGNNQLDLYCDNSIDYFRVPEYMFTASTQEAADDLALQYAYANIQCAPVVQTASLLEYVGVPFVYYITASNHPTYYSQSGETGLHFDTVSGSFTGAIFNEGTYVVSQSAYNSQGSGSATMSITVTETPPPPENAPMVTNTSQSVTNAVTFTYQIIASNSPTSYASSNLPSGWNLDATSGQITNCVFNIPHDFNQTVFLSATNNYGSGYGSASFYSSSTGPTCLVTNIRFLYDSSEAFSLPIGNYPSPPQYLPATVGYATSVIPSGPALTQPELWSKVLPSGFTLSNFTPTGSAPVLNGSAITAGTYPIEVGGVPPLGYPCYALWTFNIVPKISSVTFVTINTCECVTNGNNVWIFSGFPPPNPAPPNFNGPFLITGNPRNGWSGIVYVPSAGWNCGGRPCGLETALSHGGPTFEAGGAEISVIPDPLYPTQFPPTYAITLSVNDIVIFSGSFANGLPGTTAQNLIADPVGEGCVSANPFAGGGYAVLGNIFPNG